MALVDLKLSLDDFLRLTPYDFHLLLDRHYEKLKEDAQIMRNVMFNAGQNLMRKRGSSEIPLFPDERKMTIEEKIEERKELFG
ncbi:hypothetical protein ERICIV_00894 [Paenibacillus larvae subsp. larvae]|uniref:Phage protein n=1 Tax=Paenibacillus larvae subsp. larvae TaxID=147375 RepID=A0A2L1TWW3_9BACL|nr:hypothetical protein [Paenibacillus larvae]AVF25098.1 hypothetical protein ERICIII_00891 [Paenibacillus larvae subsp. larvae]AVF29862.1 hypothetical protein ERICIV_00894 [Paenibacillus larvae subsp. larvae]MCY7520671.1 hypothetical protein [Paenibacillus larvae]MCY9500198.1 hypothetical protein [Paenibacillus larvae]MCY9679760.1 hypothetical protein [Paenibacillus larvae]